MNKSIALIILSVAAVICIYAQDPAVTDGDKYKVILENDKVRVLEYTDKPGEKTILEYESMEFDLDISPAFFSEQKMKRARFCSLFP